MSQQVVAQAKRELEAAGEDLSGPCGAFKIANLAAKKLGLGILHKPSGNNCQGFATDIVMARDGRIWDVLVDGGGANGPAWNAGEPVDPSRYRDPVGTTPQPPEPPQPPQPPTGLDPALVSFMANVNASLARIEHTLAQPITIPPITVTAPPYEGTVEIRYLGTGQVKLKPVP